MPPSVRSYLFYGVLGYVALLLGLLPMAQLTAADAAPAATQPTTTHPEALSGGEATVLATSRQAFSLPVPGLSPAQQTDFFVGNSFFNRNWVSAPASTTARDGLGPLFNARSCSGCHLRDGRGHPPLTPTEPMISMLLRLSMPGSDRRTGVVPEPRYGDQLNSQAIPGVVPEGNVRITYEERPGQFADGEPFHLRQPTYAVTDLQYGPLHPETRLSPRVAPAMIGLGLLEAVPEDAILSRADPDDRDADGISGRPNWVWDVAAQQSVLGRFGWKANQPSVAQQTSGAFLGDIGITSTLFPYENCTGVQDTCHKAPSGGRPEIAANLLDQVIFYSRTLAVPARREVAHAVVRRGQVLFAQAQCTRCHLPTLRTGDVEGLPPLSQQTIHPYTDLLLHDMGEGLADNRPDFEATGREWRTAPLWGIGLVPTVNGHTTYLHDGRGRNLSEAILWHGGEAEAAREHFRHMTRADREALLRFLASL